MIVFARECYEALVEHAIEGSPLEVCGVLGGSYHEERSTVSSSYRATNVADRPKVRYAIGPEEQLELIERIEDDGDDVVGYYHSHPAGPPRPSETDVERATWPGRSYVIVALDGTPYLGSWRWREARGFQPEHVGLLD